MLALSLVTLLPFTFAVQMITGFFLWTAYSPSSQTAWESVWYIQHQMTLGWLLRGIHHYTAQAMVVLLAIHMLQVVIDGAYRAHVTKLVMPRLRPGGVMIIDNVNWYLPSRSRAPGSRSTTPRSARSP